MKITLWGTRGSLPSAGPETVRYGGNTSCVEVRARDGTLIVLDAGTGIRRLSQAVSGEARRVHLLLTHLHMDHIQGFGFFEPLYRSDAEVHVWGPPSTRHDLRTRLTRYLSPPLFPVRLRDLPCRLFLHDVPMGEFAVESMRVHCAPVCHPGPTVGYRLTEGGGALVYLPDHEPALGVQRFPLSADWTSGAGLAREADLLIHDAQYTLAEYERRPGWGHSALPHTLAFARLVGARRLVTFHHDPSHGDAMLDELLDEARRRAAGFDVIAGQEGLTLEVR
ncbi:MAG TPA: MBL fold metallo-hydrolase [bacterium]|nr:MBL fold metallo-hydrolase [bacterium]